MMTTVDDSTAEMTDNLLAQQALLAINVASADESSDTISDTQNVKQYERVSINGNKWFGDDFDAPARPCYETGHPINLLSLVLSNPNIGQAVRHVIFASGLSDWLNETGEHGWKPQETDAGFATDFYGTEEDRATLSVMEIHPIDLYDFGLNATEKSEWRTVIDNGSHSATFAILLTQLPNIEILRFPNDLSHSKPWLDKLFQHANSTPGTKVLAQLKEVHVAHGDTEGTDNLESIDELILIPSLRKFEGHMLGDEDGVAEYQSLKTWNGDQRTSNIEEVNITMAGMVQHDIAEFLKPLVKLNKLDLEPYFDFSFYLEHQDFEDDEDVDAEHTFTTEFEEVAGKMLEERSLVWKANDSVLKIRKQGLNEHELDDFEEA